MRGRFADHLRIRGSTEETHVVHFTEVNFMFYFIFYSAESTM